MATGSLWFSFNDDLVYMTKPEARAFQQMRNDGRLSFFRTVVCAAKGCNAEVIKGKTYCSKDCFENGLDSGSNSQGDGG